MNRWAGMMVEREAASVHCSKCGQDKPPSEFHKHAGRKSGLQSWCKLCNRAESKARYYEEKGKCQD